jgi:hypothetical protein
MRRRTPTKRARRVYSRRRSSSKSRSKAKTSQQRKFATAARKCKGRPGKAFRACMSRELSR